MPNTEAVAYYRTSSAANVGDDKDSMKRQQAAVTAYAKRHGFDIVAEYYDAAVSGSDPVGDRPGFAAMSHKLLGNGVRVVLVENASRFARDLIVQLTGHAMLRKRGIELVPVDAPDHFTNETPTAELIRQILGAVAQFEKAAMVERLRGARERKRADKGRCEGRKSWAEKNPALVREARRLARRNPRSRKRSLPEVSRKLAAQGFVNSKGRPFGVTQIARMLGRPAKR